MTTEPNEGLSEALSRLQSVEQVGSNRWRARCPLHDDHRPSLLVDVKIKDGAAHPFIWCGVCGSVFNEVLAAIGVGATSLYRGLTFQGVDYRRLPPATRPVSLAKSDYRFVRSCFGALLGDPARLGWLHDVRGISPNTVIKYCLGFRESNGTYQIPVYENGTLVNVREYRPSTDAGTHRGIKVKGLPGVGRAVYPDPVDIGDEPWVLLVEGEFDALIARQHGLPAVTQTAGASAALPSDCERYFRGKNVAVCYDCDEAGRNGAMRVADQLRKWGCCVCVIDLGLGRGEDVTDWFVRYGRTARDLKLLITRTWRANGSKS